MTCGSRIGLAQPLINPQQINLEQTSSSTSMDCHKQASISKCE
uniref:Uncharacterized protein n=1 Tax=Anguilla anguilla TaxID=7936 RepID=A0A0E9R1B1_ANGAN